MILLRSQAKIWYLVYLLYFSKTLLGIFLLLQSYQLNGFQEKILPFFSFVDFVAQSSLCFFFKKNCLDTIPVGIQVFDTIYTT